MLSFISLALWYSPSKVGPERANIFPEDPTDRGPDSVQAIRPGCLRDYHEFPITVMALPGHYSCEDRPRSLQMHKALAASLIQNTQAN